MQIRKSNPELVYGHKTKVYVNASAQVQSQAPVQVQFHVEVQVQVQDQDENRDLNSNITMIHSLLVTYFGEEAFLPLERGCMQSFASASSALQKQQPLYDPHHPDIISIRDAHRLLEQTLQFYNHNPHPALSLAYNILGTAYHRIGTIKDNILLLQTALSYFKSALAIDLLVASRESSHFYTVSITCNYIGMVCCDLNNLNSALQYHEAALSIKIAFSNHYKRRDIYIADSYNNLARVYSKLNDHEKTIACYETGLMVADGYYQKPTEFLAKLYHNLACYHESTGDIVFARTFYTMELSISQQLGLAERIKKVNASLYSLAFTEAENDYMKRHEIRTARPSVQGVFGGYQMRQEAILPSVRNNLESTSLCTPNSR